MVRSGNTQYWMDNKDMIPEENAIIIYTDYKTAIDSLGVQRNIPCMKIGDGQNSVESLAFLDISSKVLDHSLTIGENVFDGSQDVTIPIYDGSIL